MKLLRLPGVHRPRSDTWLLADALERENLGRARILDVCTGTGAVAIAAARHPEREVFAVDLTWRAALTARVNAWLNRVAVRVRRGDLFAPVAGMRVDAIVANPPYLPADTDRLPRHRARVALDAGRDGRTLIDRICLEAPAHLRPGGRVLIVHSSLCGTERTCEELRRQGLEAEVVERRSGPLGPLLRARIPMLRRAGLLGEHEAEEELVVVRGRLPEATAAA